jgi:hypothetical protein
MTLSGWAAALALCVPLSAAAAQLPPLSQDAKVTGPLVAAAAGNRIRKACPDIAARKVRVFLEAQRLVAYARGQGYSQEEIDAFIDSDVERERIKQAAASWLVREGARENDTASLCVLGRREIDRGSYIGSLLHAR